MLSGGRSTAGARLAGPSRWDGVRLGKRLSQGAQILRQGRVETLVEQTLERFVTAPRLRFLQGLEIGEAIFRTNCDRRKAAPDENQIHQQSRCPAIAVVERM